MKNPRIEIRQVNGEAGIFTEIYIDGHKLSGVRRFELKQEAGDSIPILTIDLNALDLSTDVMVLKLNQYGMGEISEISFKNTPTKDFIFSKAAEISGINEGELREKILSSWQGESPHSEK